MFDRIDKGLWWDRAWTLVEGCMKVSPGCLHCWAERDTWRRAHMKNEQISERSRFVVEEGRWNGKLWLRGDDQLILPHRVRKPTAFAVWNDLFHEDVPFGYIDLAFEVIKEVRNKHIIMILTKRPKVALRFFQTSSYAHPHAWIGVTAENHEEAERRIPILLQIPAAKQFISIEPMLGTVDLSRWIEQLDWVIVGGETGPGARSIHTDWVRSIRDQCQAAGVPFFFKGWGGKKKAGCSVDGQEWKEVPEGVRE